MNRDEDFSVLSALDDDVKLRSAGKFSLPQTEGALRRATDLKDNAPGTVIKAAMEVVEDVRDAQQGKQ